MANVGITSEHVERHADMSYGEGARRRLDVYTNANFVGRPVVIFWYGGSWEMGRKADYRFVGAKLAQQGFVALIPDYPLYPSARFPQYEGDGARVIAWALAHAQEYGGDPQKIVLMGHSAGAHTAAFLAYNHDYLRHQGVDPDVIRGLVGLSGPYELVPDTPHLRVAFAAPYSERDWQPVRFVDVHSPPTLLLHGLSDHEVLPKESIDLRNALERNHVPVELHLYPHRRHGATVAPFSPVLHWRTPVVQDTVDFINRVTADAGHP